MMPSKQSTVDFILEQIGDAGIIAARKMFGEYAIYCNQKVVGLVCDDQLFIKPTQGGKDFLQNYVEGFPYPGAKPYFLIEGGYWDDREWMIDLVKITEALLPLPKKKKTK